ncbi:MAG TPA: LacI family DNA-binding transcriptional regulator [Capsulimonadaceae bacterium]|jgi:DNA-binding LacI/PurR family transcriptional regulator
MTAPTQTAAPTSKRKPNVFDVARLAGVSQTTVSFVLNGSTSPRISEATSRRVHEAVKQLGYRPNTLARSLAHGKTLTVGLVLPCFDDDFHGRIVKECQNRLAENGYQLLFVHAAIGSAAEARMVEFLLQHRVDAIACFVHSATTYVLPEWLRTINSAGIPAVVIDNMTSPDQADSVCSDDMAGMDTVVEHLYGLGHREIAILAAKWPEDLVPIKVKGFEAAMRQRGLTPRLVAEDVTSPSSALFSAEMLRLMGSPNPPTAFVAHNDYQFEDFLQNHAGRDVRVPEEISLVGYGDSYLSRMMRLTTVGQQPDLTGRTVAERLLDRLENPQAPAKRTEIPTELLVRGSTAAPARR